MNQSFSDREAIPGERSKLGKSDDTVDIGAILRTLWRGKLIIAGVTILFILAGGYYAYRVAVPMFRATTVVMLEGRQEQVVDLESVVSGLSADSMTVNTEVEVLKSRGLLAKVVDRLRLAEDPEFNAALRTPSSTDRLKGLVRNFFSSNNTVARPVRTAAEIEAQQRSSAVSALRGALTVHNIPLSLVFQVTVETTEPQKSVLIADTLAELYILNQLDVKFEATEQATTWLSERVTQLQGELETAEQQVKDFRANTTLIDQESLAAMERQLKELRERTESMVLQQESQQQRAEAIRTAQTPQEKVDASQDMQLKNMLPRIDAPEISAAFDTRYTQLLNRAEQEASRSTSQLIALQKSEQDLQNQIEQQSSDLIQLQQLTREAEASRLLYEYFLSRLKETSVQKGIQQADSRVISNAVTPGGPSAPRKSVILMVSALAGIIVGAALLVLREASNRAFRTARDLEFETARPVMGQVPLLPVRRRMDTVTYLATKPTSAAAEAVRNMRTSLLLSNVDKPPQIIMVSSTFPGEGKTTISLALSQNIASMGKKVLLIEGDVRRRVFSQYMNIEGADGLISVMAGEKTLEEAVVHHDTVGADILVGERTSVNAADLFSSQGFNRFLQEARQHYDYIIVDTPPVLVVPDARVIAQSCDAVMLVVKWDKTEKAQVHDALELFESVNVRVTGLVLNQINPRGMKSYGYGYGYGGRYGSYSVYSHKYYTN